LFYLLFYFILFYFYLLFYSLYLYAGNVLVEIQQREHTQHPLHGRESTSTSSSDVLQSLDGKDAAQLLLRVA
jgi:hypothetical protein